MTDRFRLPEFSSLSRTALLVSLGTIASAQSSSLPTDVSAAIYADAAEVLASTGVPSASIAIVRDGKVAYTNTYGMARLDPRTPASPPMRYSIGSISKQFTAAAILLLEQDGKLKLDDPIGKCIPDLTRSNEVTIRMLLSNTSGYQDYWPQDYVMPPMPAPTTAQQIVDNWA
jgi:CubicO group peptidase (beta-lactamase class C family)